LDRSAGRFPGCIDQSGPWPIHLSQIVRWPEAFAQRGGDWAGRIVNDPQYRFRPYLLEPGDALIFSGSSQWHHRESMAAPKKTGFATLLFFHFIPAGMRELVSPDQWARVFGVPALTAVVEEAGSAASAQFVARVRS